MKRMKIKCDANTITTCNKKTYFIHVEEEEEEKEEKREGF